MLTYWVPAYFPGFFRGFAQQIADTHNALTAVVLKAHPSSRGVVRLTGSHPQDPLRIEKRHFEAPGGPADITSMREAIKAAWALAASLNITMHVEGRVFPEPQVQSDEQIEDHILQNVFGESSSSLVHFTAIICPQVTMHAVPTMGADDGGHFSKPDEGSIEFVRFERGAGWELQGSRS
jgi:choline dehydrogenase-like flavoprotein